MLEPVTEAMDALDIQVGGEGQQMAVNLENPETTVQVRRPFDPVAHELDASFRLTKFADLKG